MNVRKLKKTYPFHMMTVIFILGVVLYAITRCFL